MSDHQRLAEALAREREERVLREIDQTLSDLDQTQSDTDQQEAEADQAVSDHDQALSDRDQHASDRDQMAADWQQTHEPESTAVVAAHGRSRVDRDLGTGERSRATSARARNATARAMAGERRDELGHLRDIASDKRDRIAQARDDAADARDRAAEERERHASDADLPPAVRLALGELRQQGAALRHQSALERLRAAADRAAAAEDRRHGRRERRDAETDELTGVLRRGAGETALNHEIERAHRSGRELTIAIVDVDGLKALNDAHGHPAGDALLRAVGTAIATALRPYDVVARWGGDEFVFAMSDTTVEDVLQRVATIQHVLAQRQTATSISAGHARLQPHDTLETLIARADAALYAAKRSRGR